MPIRSRINQYRGVNAHLHSVLQQKTHLWPGFHSIYVPDLARAIARILPPGYTIGPEISMQIRELDPDTGEPISGRKPKRKRPDITVYGTEPTGTASGYEAVPTLISPAIDEIDNPELYYPAAVIHRVDEEEGIGRAVTWIELLSPSNKPYEPGYASYRSKRSDALKSGLVLVEIDYLHQSPPVSERIPSYPDREPGSYPYTISITNPRPKLETGKLKAYGFHIDVPIPMLSVPLLGEDKIDVDFGAVYDETYRTFDIYSLQVDYAQFPVNFDAYAPDDQARIKARMQAVQDAHQRGIDLETGPFPIESYGESQTT